MARQTQPPPPGRLHVLISNNRVGPNPPRRLPAECTKIPPKTPTRSPTPTPHSSIASHTGLGRTDLCPVTSCIAYKTASPANSHAWPRSEGAYGGGSCSGCSALSGDALANLAGQTAARGP